MKSSRTGLTGEQIRAARGLVRIEQTELARRSRLSLETIKRLERTHGVVEANSRTLIALQEAFDELGVAFDLNPDGWIGVCWRAPGGRPAGVERRPPAASPPPTPPGDLCRLIYYSTGVDARDQTEPGLARIAEVAAARNAEVGVTGALIACDGRFLQVLEGPNDGVLRIFGAISCDPRHVDIKVLERRSSAHRHFQDWAMCSGVLALTDEMLAREPALRDGFRPDALSPAAALGLLAIVRDLDASGEPGSRLL